MSGGEKNLRKTLANIKLQGGIANWRGEKFYNFIHGPLRIIFLRLVNIVQPLTLPPLGSDGRKISLFQLIYFTLHFAYFQETKQHPCFLLHVQH